ncbi:aldehyde dehydrogenase, partial [Salmonella enterica subsp. enterica serovar Newport]|nr:aldehyde dehydrogenase [Salmonella enterica subsp. enterica serovar Newport]
TSNAERVALLNRVADDTLAVAEAWARTASRKKGLPAGSPLEGEEWFAGPAALIAGCRHLAATIARMEGKAFLKDVPLRQLPNGQLAATVVSNSLWDKLLFAGVKAEVWMKPGVTPSTLAAHTAQAYDAPADSREGKIALILGAGNVSSIAPLDCFQKLFCEHQTVILKLNPVNDYMIDFLRPALRSLIEAGALRIVKGGADVGAYLTEHPLVDEIHITGAQTSHDAIVWGPGEEGPRNKAAGTPKNKRPVTSELGGVGPTIVVPGPWSQSDLDYQGELIATQKLNNSGFNCIACQMLILPESWVQSDSLLVSLSRALQKAPPRPLYYPGAEKRLEAFAAQAGADAGEMARNGAPPVIVAPFKRGGDAWFENSEVFAPALSVLRLSGDDPETYLRNAIDYCNNALHGTLGANIIIHPKTIAQIGRKRFEEMVAELKYGSIAINAWTGLIFGLVKPTWGAFPGHTLDDVQSGIGFVHNTYMFDAAERTVLEQPFRAFPKPAWFVGNRRAADLGRLVTGFFHSPSMAKLPAIVWNALRG